MVLKGHGFSRAADRADKSRALAPEGKLKDEQQLNWMYADFVSCNR
jgi:phosphohistidine phosphatase SixA